MRLFSFFLALLAPILILGVPLINCTDITIYSIKSGDTLTKLAASYNVSLDVLKSLNTQIPNFDSISINQTIEIPNPGCTINLCEIVANHTVKPGDKLSNIAANSNASLAAILSVNPQVTNANFILENDTIHIPATTCNLIQKLVNATDNCIDSKNVSSTYNVVQGDTFFVIANEKLSITLESFVAANPQVKNLDTIEVGQVLQVPICGVCVSPTGGSKYANGTYTVVSGDTFKIISREKLNITLSAMEDANMQIKDFNKIETGDLLKVPICGSSV